MNGLGAICFVGLIVVSCMLWFRLLDEMEK